MCVETLPDRNEQFVAEPKIEGQFWSHLVIVLEVKGIDRSTVVDVVQVGDISAAGQSKQELRETRTSGARSHRIVGQRPIKKEIAAGRSWLEDSEFLTADFTTEFDRVLVNNPRQIIRIAVGVLNLQRRQVGGIANRIHVSKVELRHAAIDGCKGHARNAELPGNVFVKIELKTTRVNAVIAEAELVHQLCTEEVGFAERHAAIGLVFVTS